MSWSGGKDSCLACYKAIQSGYQISYLVNFISAEYKRVSFHGTPAELIQLQAEAMGIQLLQKEVQPDDYEPAFKEVIKIVMSVNSVRSVKPVNSQNRPNGQSGLNGMVFGDIYLQEHKQWVERVCKELGIKAIELLWGMRTEDILDEFIKNGFEAIVVSGKASLIDKEWIGHKVDYEFINYLKHQKPYVDLCGEGGEYHTFVVNGPIFRKPVKIVRREVIERETPYGKWYFLDMVTTD